VHISTDAVFDGKRGDYTEFDRPNPLSQYARTKLLGEEAVSAVNSQAIIARVNLFGWSLGGKRSLAEWFLNNLSAGHKISGFTDVYFCPLLANDLGRLMLDMLEHSLEGLYHVVARDCLSKYEVSVADSELTAERSLNLTLKADKLSKDLGAPPPDMKSCMERFHQQYLDGYPQIIREMQV